MVYQEKVFIQKCQELKNLWQVLFAENIQNFATVKKTVFSEADRSCFTYRT